MFQSASEEGPAKEVESYLAIKRNEVPIPTIMWMNLENSTLDTKGHT